MKYRSRLAAWSIPGLLALSCARDETPAGHRFEIRVEEGVRTAVSSAVPRFEGELFHYEEALRIRQDPEVPESLLYGPMPIYQRDSEGFFYIADQGGNRVVVYDPKGRFAGAIGRDGEGPGEFRQVSRIGLVGDVLYAWDYRLRRSTALRRDGTVLEILRRPPGALSGDFTGPNGARRELGMRGADLIYRDEAGRQLVHFTEYEMGPEGEYLGEGVSVCSPRGDFLFTIRTPPLKTANWTPLNENTDVLSPRPFRGRAGVVALPDGRILATDGVHPIIDVYGRDGELDGRIRIEFPPEPVTRAEKADILEYLRGEIERREGTGKATARVTYDNVDFSQPKDFCASMQVDDRGYIWIARPVPYWPRPGGENTTTLYLLSPEGKYLGLTRRPTNSTSVVVSAGYCLTWEREEETGLRTPVVYSMIPAADGFEY